MATSTRTVRPAQAQILFQIMEQKAVLERQAQLLLAVLVAGEDPGGILQSIDPQTGLLTFALPDTVAP